MNRQTELIRQRELICYLMIEAEGAELEKLKDKLFEIDAAINFMHNSEDFDWNL